MGFKDFFNGNAIFNKMSQAYVGSIIRAGLIAVGAVTARDVDDGQITQLAGALMAISSIAWSMYQKRQARLVLMVPLALARMTENEAKAQVADPAIQTPPVSTHPDAVPILTLSEVERSTRPDARGE